MAMPPKYSNERSSIESMGSSPPSMSGSSRSVSSDGSSLSDTQEGLPALFNPADYLKYHKDALTERQVVGSDSPRMKKLYKYWCRFLVHNYNEAMYKSFLVLAQEDAANGCLYGLRWLFDYLQRALSDCFDTDQFKEFEELAHRYHDYMDFDHGIRRLLNLLTMGGSEAAAAACHALSPSTVDLLAAWQHHVEMCNERDAALKNPRRKLHRQLAEKCKQRSKAKASKGDPTWAGDAEGGAMGAASCSAEQARRDVPSTMLPVHRGAPRSSKSPQKKAVLRARAQPWMPQAQPQASSLPQARHLPDRLGDLLGN